MASNPPGQCCTIGVRHEGNPSGKLEMVAGTETYVANPSKPNTAAIIILTDIIGHKLNNVQLIADQFAANGYLTIAPDHTWGQEILKLIFKVFQGDPIDLNRPEGFDLLKWLQNHQPEHVEPVIKAAIKWLREEKGYSKIGGVGYCFGAKYVVRGLAKGADLDVGYSAHPSLVEEEELQSITGPLSISAAVIDQMFPSDKRHKSEEILKEKDLPYQINLFSDVEHGFAVRGDISKPRVKFAKEQAFYQAVQWFDQWLK